MVAAKKQSSTSTPRRSTRRAKVKDVVRAAMRDRHWKPKTKPPAPPVQPIERNKIAEDHDLKEPKRCTVELSAFGEAFRRANLESASKYRMVIKTAGKVLHVGKNRNHFSAFQPTIHYSTATTLPQLEPLHKAIRDAVPRTTPPSPSKPSPSKRSPSKRSTTTRKTARSIPGVLHNTPTKMTGQDDAKRVKAHQHHVISNGARISNSYKQVADELLKAWAALGLFAHFVPVSAQLVINNDNKMPMHRDRFTGSNAFVEGGWRCILELGDRAMIFMNGDDVIAKLVSPFIAMNGAAAGQFCQTLFHGKLGDGMSLVIDAVPIGPDVTTRFGQHALVKRAIALRLYDKPAPTPPPTSSSSRNFALIRNGTMYRPYIQITGTPERLGYYHTNLLANRAYDYAAIALFELQGKRHLTPPLSHPMSDYSDGELRAVLTVLGRNVDQLKRWLQAVLGSGDHGGEPVSIKKDVLRLAKVRHTQHGFDEDAITAIITSYVVPERAVDQANIRPEHRKFALVLKSRFVGLFPTRIIAARASDYIQLATYGTNGTTKFRSSDYSDEMVGMLKEAGRERAIEWVREWLSNGDISGTPNSMVEAFKNL